MNVLFEFLFQQNAWLISQHQFGRHQHTLFGRRAYGNALHFLFYFKRSESLNGNDVSILQLLRHARQEGRNEFRGLFLSVPQAFGEFRSKFFVVHRIERFYFNAAILAIFLQLYKEFGEKISLPHDQKGRNHRNYPLLPGKSFQSPMVWHYVQSILPDLLPASRTLCGLHNTLPLCGL